MDGGVEIRSKAGREVVYPQHHAGVSKAGREVVYPQRHAAGVSNTTATVFSQERLEAERRRSRASGNYIVCTRLLGHTVLFDFWSFRKDYIVIMLPFIFISDVFAKVICNYFSNRGKCIIEICFKFTKRYNISKFLFVV